MSESQASSDMMMPVFVLNRPDGVFVDLVKLLATEGGFELFVERLFGSGARFVGLNYKLFLDLLYDEDWLHEAKSKTPSLRLADSIVRFLPERQSLYRRVKILHGDLRAEYMFEPLTIQESYQEPLYGEPGADGVAPVTGYEIKTREVPTKLDFDEMVADMWLKGVKFGLREDAIRKYIDSRETIRLPFAVHLEPAASNDAEIIEVCADLHRDNSPKILANGKADLGAFKNRFPHVGKGTRLLKKIPRKLGKAGRKVTGEAIEAKLPKDLDLHRLSSTGTAIEQGDDGEYIVATMDGFISIDAKSNRISITEKIETKDGISARTTGDLALAVEEFVEHGEVQEGRTVKGKHMTFMADVFGNVISDGGNITIGGNLSGGKVESIGGNVTLGKRATRATVRAREGEVVVTQCESTTLIGRIVRVEYAVNCEIVADELYADVIEGCVIAARQVNIKSCGERRGIESLVTMLVPDHTALDQRVGVVKKSMAEAEAAIADRLKAVEMLKSEPEYAKFLSLRARIESGAIKLTAEQAGNWQKLVAKNSRTNQQVAALEAEIKAQQGIVAAFEEELESSAREQESMGVGISCVIEKITGHTVGQTMRSTSGMAEFATMSGSNIKAALQVVDGRKARLFSRDDGAVDWKFGKSSGS